ncbi:hypothetical protein HMPREF9946_00646 [Acetobacteraceae bacterium AT-5844]|nr:hypothetical protein HMPREF9946_00646 [Acetobacteraceae bacterium AT-5844]
MVVRHAGPFAFALAIWRREARDGRRPPLRCSEQVRRCRKGQAGRNAQWAALRRRPWP